MKLRYFSDLHLEFIKPNKVQKFINKIPKGNDDEICIIAGDIGNPCKYHYQIFMEFISINFKKSFVIAGNHEYYNKTKNIQETNDFLSNYFLKFNNISYLNNEYEIYENYCFIGTTLWSNISNSLYKINDIYEIPKFDINQYNELNIRSIDFLNEAIQNNTNCIIITHHVPSLSLIDIKYKTEELIPYNQWFYSDLDNFITIHENKIKCWIYGHTHTPAYNILHDIPFICNPIGYPNENKDLNFQKICDIN
jgi:predicted phosphohydrolase